MKNAQHFDRTIANPVGHDKGRARDDQFARPGDAPGTSDVGIVRNQRLYHLDDSKRNFARCGWAFNADISANVLKVLYREARPN